MDSVRITDVSDWEGDFILCTTDLCKIPFFDMYFLDIQYLDESGFVEALAEFLPLCEFQSFDRPLPTPDSVPKGSLYPYLKERFPYILPSTLHLPSKHRALPAFYHSHQSLCLAGEKERTKLLHFQQTSPNYSSFLFATSIQIISPTATITTTLTIVRIVQHFLRDDRWLAFAFYPSKPDHSRTIICLTPCFDCSAADVTLASMSSIISPWSAIISAKSLNAVCTWFISVDSAKISSCRSRMSSSLYCRFALLGFTL